MQNQSSFGKSLLIVLLMLVLPVFLISQTAKVKTILTRPKNCMRPKIIKVR
jgi:hypothetical protein